MDELLRRSELQKKRQHKRVLFIIGFFLAFLGGVLLGINISNKEVPKPSEMTQKPFFEEIPEETVHIPSQPKNDGTQLETPLTFYKRLQKEPHEKMEQKFEEKPEKEALTPEPPLLVPKTGIPLKKTEGYSFQVASFKRMENAKKFAQKLLSKGIKAEVQKTDIKGMIWYRVIVQAQNQEEVQRIKELLKSEGIKEVKIYEEKS